MTKLQKIKSLIVSLVIVFVISSIGIFSYVINPKIYSFLLNNSIVSSSDNLIVHFISIGQGDAIAINLPDGKVALIDTGLTDSSVTLTDYLNERVLNTKKDKVIDYLILSHADLDHSGGAMRVLENYEVESVVLPVIDSNEDYYKKVLNFINDNKIVKINNKNLEIIGKNYKFEFFIGESRLSSNDMSHIIKLTCFDKSFLFTGDISSDVEIELIEKYSNKLDCDVLKVAHHGSKYSTCDEFLEVVTPEISVISCGKNSYGHPTSEVITNILEAGSKLYRTDTDGNIAIMLGDKYSLSVLNGDYKVLSMQFEIEILITIINFVVLIDAICIFMKKERRNKVKH